MKGNDSATMTSLEGALATVNGQPAGAVTTTTTTANSANSGNSTAAAVGGDKAFRHELENIADVSVEVVFLAGTLCLCCNVLSTMLDLPLVSAVHGES